MICSVVWLLFVSVVFLSPLNSSVMLDLLLRLALVDNAADLVLHLTQLCQILFQRFVLFFQPCIFRSESPQDRMGRRPSCRAANNIATPFHSGIPVLIQESICGPAGRAGTACDMVAAAPVPALSLIFTGYVPVEIELNTGVLKPQTQYPSILQSGNSPGLKFTARTCMACRLHTFRTRPHIPVSLLPSCRADG